MRILLLNQCFYPDVASTAQHASDLARALAAAGHYVTVVAGRRAYDDPARKFKRQEVWNGVRILRAFSFGFGKGANWRRLLDYSSFLTACCLRLVFLPRFDVVLAMSSPPAISFFAALFTRFRGGRMVSWVMDLNPDEAIAAGWLRPGSSAAGVLDWMLKHALSLSCRVVVLDEFMKTRVVNKGVPASKVAVLPPWSHDRAVWYDGAGRAGFRRELGMGEKFVVMYSGNHSPCHPLDTLVEAARRLSNHPEIVFCFVGGGAGFAQVRDAAVREKLTNVVCLPYQPIEKISASLSSADLHVVVMGEAFAGIVHPCKIYNILALGIPVLYIGPAESHIVELLSAGGWGKWAFRARHGDVDAVVSSILHCAAVRSGPFDAPRLLAVRFSHDTLVPRMIACLVADETPGGRSQQHPALAQLPHRGPPNTRF